MTACEYAAVDSCHTDEALGTAERAVATIFDKWHSDDVNDTYGYHRSHRAAGVYMRTLIYVLCHGSA